MSKLNSHQTEVMGVDEQIKFVTIEISQNQRAKIQQNYVV